MKKNIFKIIPPLIIILGISLIGNRSVSAACNNSFSGKQFDADITFNRSTKPITFTTKFKYGATGDCVGVAIPGSFYDFSFSYTLYGQDSWTDIVIPDSSVKLKGGEWSTISFAPNVTFDPNKSYEIRFIEKNELPDLKGTKKKFWTDTVSFLNPKVGEIIPDPNTPGYFKVSPFIEVIFKNSSLPAGTLVKSFELLDNLYNANGTLNKEEPVPYNAAEDKFEYNKKYLLNWANPWVLQANTTFKFVYVEKIRNALSTALNFTTPALPATTGSTTSPTTGNTSTSKTYTVVFGEPTATRFIKDTTGAVELEVPVKYTLTDKTIKSPVTEQATSVIYNKNEAKKSEYSGAYDSSYNVSYNTQSTFGYYWSELVKGNEYVFYFYDKKTGAKSPYVSLMYKTDGTFSVNKIASLPSWTTGTTTSGNSSSNTGNSSTGSTTSGNGTTQTSTADATNQTAAGFSATFSAKPEYVVDYDNGIDAVRVNGTIKYTSTTNQVSLTTAGAGNVYVELIDKNNRVKVIDNIDLTGTSKLARDVVIPLNSNLMAIGNSVDPDVASLPIFTQADAPFRVLIRDYGMDVKSIPFTVAMPGTSGNTNTNTNTNNNTSTNSNTSTDVQSDVKTASDGTTVTFNIDSSDLKFKTDASGKETASAVVHGHIIYGKSVNKTAKMNKIQAKVYNTEDRTVATGNMQISTVTSTDMEFSGTFTGLNPSEAPFSFDISDKDMDVTSGKFYIDQAQTIASVNQSGALVAPQSGTSPAAANGSKVTFGVTSAVFNEKDSTIKIDGSVAYSAATTGTTPTAKNILVTMFNGSGTQVQADLAKVTGNNFSITFTGMDATKAPFEFTLKDADLNVASPNKFKVTSAAAAAADAKQSSFGLFQNPLRKGLDSIPEIVSALVKNIVIPIAVPFLALAIIYTGFLFIQARGNSTKLEEAKTALKWTLIGGALILAAYVIATALQGTIADIIK